MVKYRKKCGSRVCAAVHTLWRVCNGSGDEGKRGRGRDEASHVAELSSPPSLSLSLSPHTHTHTHTHHAHAHHSHKTHAYTGRAARFLAPSFSPTTALSPSPVAVYLLTLFRSRGPTAARSNKTPMSWAMASMAFSGAFCASYLEHASKPPFARPPWCRSVATAARFHPPLTALLLHPLPPPPPCRIPGCAKTIDAACLWRTPCRR